MDTSAEVPKKKSNRGRSFELDATRALAIRKRYWRDGASTHEIAKEEGVNHTTIMRFMAKHGIERRSVGPRKGHSGGAAEAVLDDAEKRTIVRALRAGKKTQSALAREYGVSRQSIHHIYKEAKDKDE